jgi:tetratricopeptide (TPR) repeat protein
VFMRDFFNKVITCSVSDLHSKGLNFFNVLLSRLDHIDKKEISLDVYSKTWMLISDIYYLNDAPLLALRACETAILANAKNGDAYLEASKISLDIGQYQNAMTYIQNAIGINPDDDEYIEHFNEVSETIKINAEPMYDITVPLSRLKEELAGFEFQEVLDKVNMATDHDNLKVKAAALGGLGKADSYLDVWTKIFNQNTEVLLERADWFYMPQKVYESPEIWYLMLDANEKIAPGVFEIYDCFEDEYKVPPFDRRELICLYHIYAATHNMSALKNLSEKFPKWYELKRTINDLRVGKTTSFFYFNHDKIGLN